MYCILKAWGSWLDSADTGGGAQSSVCVRFSILFFCDDGGWRVEVETFNLAVAHAASCLLRVYPTAFRSHQCITAKPPHASALLSSPTQGHSCAL